MYFDTILKDIFFTYYYQLSPILYWFLGCFADTDQILAIRKSFIPPITPHILSVFDFFIEHCNKFATTFSICPLKTSTLTHAIYCTFSFGDSYIMLVVDKFSTEIKKIGYFVELCNIAIQCVLHCLFLSQIYYRSRPQISVIQPHKCLTYFRI